MGDAYLPATAAQRGATTSRRQRDVLCETVRDRVAQRMVPAHAVRVHAKCLASRAPCLHARALLTALLLLVLCCPGAMLVHAEQVVRSVLLRDEAAA